MAVTKSYDDEIQQCLISLMVSNPQVFTQVRSILDPDFFNKGPTQNAIRYILNYNKNYNTIPTIEEIYANTKVSILKSSGDLNPNNILAISSEIEAFCKKRKLELAILQCASLIEEDKAESIDRIVKEALLFGLQKDLGVDYFENPAERLKKLISVQGLVPTGWRTLDGLLQGGVFYGDLIYFVAPTGGGKSICLQNFARKQVLRGLNVVYITHELNQELVGKRIDSLFTNIPLREVNNQIDNIHTKVVEIGNKENVGSFQLKWLRASSTVLDIESYINNYETATGRIVNIIISDYADLLNPTVKVNLENIHIKDKYVSEELRDFAQERTLNGKPTLIATASQLTKSGQTDEEINLSNISGGISKGYACDTMIASIASPAMRDQNRMNFMLIKSRNSGGVGKVIHMKRDQDTLVIDDYDEQAQQHTYQAQIYDAVKNRITNGNLINTETEIVDNSNVFLQNSNVQDILTKKRKF